MTDIYALYYRACGHVVMAGANRADHDQVARTVTGVAVRIATDADLRALMRPRPRRCLCRVRDRSVLAAWHRTVTASTTPPCTPTTERNAPR